VEAGVTFVAAKPDRLNLYKVTLIANCVCFFYFKRPIKMHRCS